MKKYLLYGFGILAVLISIFVEILYVRVILGMLTILFIPGYVITYIFQLGDNYLERTLLSFALSIATLPLMLFILNLLGIPIIVSSILLTVLGFVIVGFTVQYIRKA